VTRVAARDVIEATPSFEALRRLWATHRHICAFT
jgi:hypothetical protein